MTTTAQPAEAGEQTPAGPAYRTIRLEISDRIATITLDRPERLNAISDGLMNDLDAAFDHLESGAAEPHRVVIIKGNGRAFSAGFDVASDSEEIGYAEHRDAVADRNRQLRSIDVFMRLWRHPLPVIAQVHGYCMAGATQLCVFSDLTYVADDTVLSASPALPIGGGFISPLWSTLVGPKRAKLMSFDAGHRISGVTAAAWGWATEAVPAADLDAHVRATAVAIARTPAGILTLKKEAANRTLELQGLVTIARLGTETDALLHLTPEIQELQESIRTRGLKGAIAHFEEHGVGR